MRVVHVDLAHRSYPIYIAAHLLDKIAALFRESSISRRIFLVVTPNVFELYGGKLTGTLQEAGFETTAIFIPDGERTKSIHTVENIYTFLIAQRAERSSTIVAVGGGVTGDIAGFAAATYLRGVPYVQVPTTLLSQVDASVGGKTGVNHPHGKNLIGAFYQPTLVCVDLTTLSTLPERDFRSGVYEILKYGIIYDREFFEYLDNHLEALLSRDEEVLEYVICRSCQIKGEVISQDEQERDLRRILNFGHTYAHALEVATHFHEITHGEAVGWGMLATIRLSRMIGRIDQETADRLSRVISRVGDLPNVAEVAPETLLEAMERDKKRINGLNLFLIVDEIGKVSPQQDLATDLIRKAWKQIVNPKS